MMIVDVLIAASCGAAGWGVPSAILWRHRLRRQVRSSTHLLARAARLIGDASSDRMVMAGDLEAARDEIDRLRDQLRHSDALAVGLLAERVVPR